jgi:hypothetical protein
MAKRKVKRPRTAAQTAASRRNIKLAQAARGRAYLWRNRGKASTRANRGEGKKGLKANFVPFLRTNKRGTTVGYNVGTYIPGTNKRFVRSSTYRIENSTRKPNSIDRALARATDIVAPRGTRRGAARNYLRKNVIVTNPAFRAALGPNAEVRLGTSRGAGPTVIVRRGRHKISQQASRKAIKRYDTNARKLNARRATKPRPQRRNAKK